MSRRIVVEHLRLRVDGLEPAAAARLGAQVARRLAAQLAGGPAPPAQDAVRVRVAPHGPPSADRIADAVARRLR